ncbi:MAG: HD domain-containing phosphohydrolase, partial [Pseudomonadota bacterium]
MILKKHTTPHPVKQDNSLLLDKYKTKVNRLTRICRLSAEIATTLDLPELLNSILEEIRRIVGASIGSVLLIEDDKYLAVKAAVGDDRDKVIGLTNELFQNRISSSVVKSGKPVLFDKTKPKTAREYTSEQLRAAYDSIMSVPLIVCDKTIGVINFGVKTGKRKKPFTREDLDFVHIISGHIAGLIINALKQKEVVAAYDRLREAYLLTVQALTRAIDAKDHYTHGHSHRVALYAVATGKKLRLSEKELERLYQACILHDIGRIAVSETILNKSGRLTGDEMAEIETHPERAASIIGDFDFLADIRKFVLHHHERYDGKGYPNGLSGEDIPLHSRIIAIADAFDAMTTDRPHRKGIEKRVAVDEIVRCSGLQFDPSVVSAFVEAY